MDTGTIDRQVIPARDGFAPLTPVRGHVFDAPPPRTRPRIGVWALFLATVALPVALAAAYFFALAADRYESVSLFVLRTPQSVVGPAVGQGKAVGESAMQGGIPRLGQDDSFAVRDYVLSRAGLRAVQEKIDPRIVLSAPFGDIFWHFPNVLSSDTEEALFRHYLRMVSLKYDFNTGGSELRVQAMAPDHALRLSTVLLGAAEDLVNRLNARAEQDALRTAEEDVALAKADTDRALGRLAAFRERERMIDPAGSAKVIAEVLIKLTTYLVETRAEVEILRKAAFRSPQLPVLEARVASIQAQIDHEKRALTGSEDGLAGRIAEYERLAMDKEFGIRRTMLAMAALEAARRDTGRKKVYLERVAEPALSDEAVGPWRIVGTLVVATICLSLFGTIVAVRRGG